MTEKKKYEYICRKCDFEGKFNKERVRCPDCSKNSLIEKSLIQPLETSLPEKNKKTRLITDEQPIFTGNTFVDDLTECTEDLDFTKKIGYKVSTREKKPSSLVEKKCSQCANMFKSLDGRGYLCNKCCGAPR